MWSTQRPGWREDVERQARGRSATSPAVNRLKTLPDLSGISPAPSTALHLCQGLKIDTADWSLPVCLCTACVVASAEECWYLREWAKKGHLSV
ncbi:hypothetical protein MHYP_G00076260 [Metynnis hypsauchen]